MRVLRRQTSIQQRRPLKHPAATCGNILSGRHNSSNSLCRRIAVAPTITAPIPRTLSTNHGVPAFCFSCFGFAVLGRSKIVASWRLIRPPTVSTSTLRATKRQCHSRVCPVPPRPLGFTKTCTTLFRPTMPDKRASIRTEEVSLFPRQRHCGVGLTSGVACGAAPASSGDIDPLHRDKRTPYKLKGPATYSERLIPVCTTQSGDALRTYAEDHGCAVDSIHHHLGISRLFSEASENSYLG